MAARTIRTLIADRISASVTQGIITLCQPRKPLAGSTFSQTEKIRTSMIASQKFGNDSPISDSARIAWSANDPARTAA